MMERDIVRGSTQICIWCAADVSITQINTEAHRGWVHKQ